MKIFARPPFVGIIAFMAVLVVQPLGHIVMIILENVFDVKEHGGWYNLDVHGTEPTIPADYFDAAMIFPNLYWSAFAMGLAGLIIIVWGMKRGTEVAGTWAGFVGGTLVWTGWVEFSLHFHARYFGTKAMCAPGLYSYACMENPATKPEYLWMQGSVGFLLSIGLFFAFNKETRCNAFRWMHRHLKIPVGKPTRGLTRNFANIVAAETIGILWFFYVYLMFIYDETFFGEHHWFTYFSCAGFFVWSLYLIQRLIRYKRVTSALRYAIPTVIIFWNSLEILGRWDLFEEFWIHPDKYRIQAALTFIAFVAFAVISIRSALDKSRQIESN